MKKSTLIHVLSIGAGLWGALALVAAWLAGENGSILGFSQTHFFNDAIVLTLLSISGGVCALYRLHLERKA